MEWNSSSNLSAIRKVPAMTTKERIAVNLMRRAGQVVIAGLFGGEFKMPLPMLALKSIAISGSYGGGVNDLRELVALAQRETLPSIPLDARPMNAVDQALDDLTHGRVVGRVVL